MGFNSYEDLDDVIESWIKFYNKGSKRMKPKKRKFANGLKFTKPIYIWFKDQCCNVIGLDDEHFNNKVCLEDYFGAFLVLLVFGRE